MNDTAFLVTASALISADEGCRLEAYRDTVGVWTVGYGHAHVEPGTCWTQATANKQLREDLQKSVAQLDSFLPWWRSLDDARRYVLLNMAFQLGTRGLLEFGHTLEAIRGRAFSKAAQLMLASKWALQVPHRAHRLARILTSGRLPPLPTTKEFT